MDLTSSLSTELHAQVVQRLLEIISELAYALELRLVCKKFNDIVMHELFSAGEYQLTPTLGSLIELHPFLPRKTPAMRLDPGTGANTVNLCWVKRQYLLARIANPRSLDYRRVTLFQHLQAAAQDLEALSRENARIDCDLRAALSPLTSSGAGNVGKELGAFIVCEAALSFFDNRAILDHTQSLMPKNIEDTDPSYWLVNVACWSGSLALLDYLEARAPHLPVAESPIIVSASQCLPTAICRGHKEIIKHILRLKPLSVLEHKSHWPCPIEAAICVGDLSTVNLMLELVDTIPISRRIFGALNRARPKYSQLKDYIAILQRLLPMITALRPVERSLLTINIADAGGPAGVDLLAGYSLLSADLVRLVTGRYSALDSPSYKGDVSTIKKLFDVSYFRNINLTAVDVAIARAANIALSWGHAEVFEELSKPSRQLDTTGWIPRLAAANGTLHRLQDLCKSVEVMHAPVVTTSDFCTEPNTVGQAALERAMQSLKPANVEYILNMGIRLAHGHQIVHISWSYSRHHQAALLTTQQMLASYGLPTIELSV